MKKYEQIMNFFQDFENSSGFYPVKCYISPDIFQIILNEISNLLIISDSTSGNEYAILNGVKIFTYLDVPNECIGLSNNVFVKYYYFTKEEKHIHSWKHYIGFTETYDFCETCQEKKYD